MNIPTPIEIINNLKILLSVARLEKGSTAQFDTSAAGIKKSFILAPFLFPIFFFEIARITWVMDESVLATTIAPRVFLVYVTLWTLFPVVLYSGGLRDNLHKLVVARNWLMVANFLLALLVGLAGPLALFGILIGLYMNVMNWFIIRDTLQESKGKTTLLFFVEMILSSCITAYYFVSAGVDFEAYLAASQAAMGAK